MSAEPDFVNLPYDDEPETPAPAPSLPEPPRRKLQPIITPRELGAPPGGSGMGGRTPPFSIEAEEYLLSACLLDNGETIGRCLEAGLGPAAFYVPANRVIYEKIVQIYSDRHDVDTAMLVEELRTSKQLEAVGGIPYVLQISARVPTSAEASYFTAKLRELHVLRELIRVATGAVEQCYSYQGELSTLLEEVKEQFAAVADRASGGERDTGRPATDFTYPADDDPDILIGGEDFVGRGGALFLVSVTGAGKSPLQLDMCMDWALGRPWHGLRSAGPIKSLIIQHEDSDRYLGKIIGSYVFANKLTPEEEAMLRENLIVKSLRGCNGPDFYRELARLKRRHRPKMIGINPLYLYAEGDISKSEPALRAITNLERVNADRESAYFIIHHTGKPPKRDDKQFSELEDWEAIYMGIGSSYWANWPRASMFLQPTEDLGHYVLRLGKGAMNAGITHQVPQGAGYRLEAVTQIPLKHSTSKIKVEGRERPLILWEADGEGGGGGNGKSARKISAGLDLELFLRYFPNPGSPARSIQVIYKLARTHGGQESKVWQEMHRAALNAGLIKQVSDDGFVRTTFPPTS
jgi:DnaB-like helicase N terminal domain/AAA domain